MKASPNRKELWSPATDFYKNIRGYKKKKNATEETDGDNNLLLKNLLKTNLQLLKNLDLSNTVLF